MIRIDVTRRVEISENLGALSITKCVCGATFEAWRFIITPHSIGASQCPECHRRLHYAGNIRVYEVRG